MPFPPLLLVLRTQNQLKLSISFNGRSTNRWRVLMVLPTNLVLILISLWPASNSVDSMHRSPIVIGGPLLIFNLILNPILNLRDRPVAGIHQPCGAGQNCFVLFICAFFYKVHFCQNFQAYPESIINSFSLLWLRHTHIFERVIRANC